MQEHAKYLSRKNELNSTLTNVKKRLEMIAGDNQRLAETRQARTNLFEELIRTAQMQQRKYQEIIALFASNKAEVLSDLDFSAHISFDCQGLLKGLVDVLDNRQVQVMGDEQVPSKFEDLQTFYRHVTSGDENAIAGLVAETNSLCEEMKPS